MYYYRFYISTPYSGTDSEEWLMEAVPMTNDELADCLSEFVYAKAESFAHLRTGWSQEFESEDEREQWIDDCFESSYYEEGTRIEYVIYCNEHGIIPQEEE